MTIWQFAATLSFYIGFILSLMLVPILTLINAVLFSPLYIYKPRYFLKTQMRIVIFGYSLFTTFLNPFISTTLESNEDDSKVPAIYVFNHLSNSDPFVLGSLIKINHAFVYKDSINKIPFCGWTLASAGNICIKFQYQNGKKIPIKESLEEMFRTCKKRLEMGISLLVFPEGTRSNDGKLHQFRNGFFKFALENGYPLVPCAIHGTDRILPRGSAILNPGRASIRIGKLIHPYDILGEKPNEVTEERVCKVRDRLRLEIYKLLRKCSNFREDEVIPELEQQLKPKAL